MRQEATTGLDVTINVPQFRIILGLQFKAPRSKKFILYYFRIADKARRGCSSLTYSDKIRPKCLNQHIAMLISAIALKIAYGYDPPPIFYALPLIYDAQELETNATNLLNRTKFINITAFPPMTFIDCQTHEITINERTGKTLVHSTSTEIKAINAKELIEILRKLLEEHETIKKKKQS